jgi:hypothetical protein
MFLVEADRVSGKKRRDPRNRARLFGIVSILVGLGGAPSEASTYVVDRLTDSNPSGGGAGSGQAGDLRFAITHAVSGDAIVVTVEGTIVLAGSLPALSHSVCLQGPGADRLTVQGVGGTVISVGAGATVLVSGVTVTGGSGNGGGVFNQGTLTLVDDAIRDNTAGDATNGNGTGAGVWNYVGAVLTLDGTTVSGNTAIGNLVYAPSRGGGIANYGTLTLINSTISGNSAPGGHGGGISNSLPESHLEMVNVTVSDNAAPGSSSGGLASAGSLTTGNSIVAGNADGDLSGNVLSEGYNLFGTTDGSGFDPTDLLGVDPALGPLQNNGGTTETMAPLPGSPALDRIPGAAGTNYPDVDQRGVARPQGNGADSGAVEAATLSPLRAAAVSVERAARRVGLRSFRAPSLTVSSPEARMPVSLAGVPGRAPRSLDRNPGPVPTPTPGPTPPPCSP